MALTYFRRRPRSAVVGTQDGESRFNSIDGWLLSAAVLLSLFGLITMYSFSAENTLFEKQAIWIVVSIVVCLGASVLDYSFLRRPWPVTIIYASSVTLLAVIYVVGVVSLGARSRFNLGVLAIQPTDPAKLALIIVLAKYFAKRHVAIAHIRHILVSGLYAGVIFILVFFQPDLGSAVIIFLIWLVMVLVAGISKKHLLALGLIGLLLGAGMWFTVLKDYQKQRVLTFLHPLADVRGAGYNAHQAMIAVGSGLLTGKGIGYGTQSKLRFLPEFETDFIVAAFAEEWGFIGLMLMFALFGVVVWRVLSIASMGATNFESLFGIGVAALIVAHFVIHVGINVGVLPVTGTTIPFMSYGGSHLVTEYAALGMLMGMRRYGRSARRVSFNTELVGVGATL